MEKLAKPRYMIIDIGSNTVKCDVYEVTSKSEFCSLGHYSTAVGFISHVFDGKVTKEGEEKLIDVIKRYKSLAVDMSLNGVFAFATASLRALDDATPLIERINEETGVSVRLLSGKEEAFFSLSGALWGNPEVTLGVAVDMGGASTELNFFKDRKSVFSVSLPFGALSLKNRFVGRDKDFHDASHLLNIERFVKETVNDYLSKVDKSTLYSEKGYIIGGSAKALGFLCESSGICKRDSITPESLALICEKYAVLDDEEKEFLIKSYPDRYKIVVPSIVAYKAITEALGAKKLSVSKTGIKDGYLYYLLNEKNIYNFN